MKTLKTIFLLLYGLATMALGARVETLAWDANPATDGPLVVYEVFLGAVQVATTAATQVDILLPYAGGVVTVRAGNAWGVSPMSVPLEIPSIYPDLTIQFSADLVEWSDLPFPAARFYRIKQETSSLITAH